MVLIKESSSDFAVLLVLVPLLVVDVAALTVRLVLQGAGDVDV